MKKDIYQMELLEDSKINIAELDYLILASGSDTRAYEVLGKIASHLRNKIIVIHFKERLQNLALSDPLFNFKKLTLPNLQEITSEIKDPSSCLEEIQLNNFSPTSKIAIDISCFTKPYFYFLLKLLCERFKIANILAFYTEPKSYLFTNGLFSTFHTNSGPLVPWEIPGYSGYEARGSKRRLIILLGFDGDLSKEINEDVSPNETIVINGFPSYTPKFKDISLIANEKLVSDHNITIKYARANNPFDIYNVLNRIKNKGNPGFFMNIAPLGTKPMALGACLFALHNPDVRIIYPLPENYENKYSDMCWNSWVYGLPLMN
jgi:hypothetical protein